MTDQTIGVVREAHKRAEQDGAILTFLYVLPSTDLWSPLFPHRHETAVIEKSRVAAETAEKVLDYISSVTGRPRDGLSVCVETMPLDAAVVKVAIDTESDLIVIGPECPNRVLHYARCPVLIVRGESRDGCVLAATDLTDPSFPVISAAKEEAFNAHRPLTVLFNIDFPAVSPMGPGAELGAYVFSEQEIKQVTAQARAQLQAAMDKVDAHGVAVVANGRTAEEILNVAKDRDCGLIVIRPKWKNFLTRLLLGSVAEIVAKQAPCPVLVVRSHLDAERAAAA